MSRTGSRHKLTMLPAQGKLTHPSTLKCPWPRFPVPWLPPSIPLPILLFPCLSPEAPATCAFVGGGQGCVRRCMCVHMSMDTCEQLHCTCVHVEARGIFNGSSLSCSHGSLLVVWLVQQSGRYSVTLCLRLPEARITGKSHAGFRHTGLSGHSNSDPQACTASPLSTEPPFQPRLYLVFTSPPRTHCPRQLAVIWPPLCVCLSLEKQSSPCTS